jgi:D-alanyl-D-alanine carboxypeptidase
MTELFNGAKSKGITVAILSAYRSYQTQITTYNYWVGEQKKKGMTQAQAEIAASQISAKAGHSEHQLGTTADLKCSTCSNFDNSAGNLALYSFLETDAYKYGFVISYPKGKESLTGYSYEPWHIRFIGKDLAQSFFEKGYLSDPKLSSTILLRQLS